MSLTTDRITSIKSYTFCKDHQIHWNIRSIWLPQTCSALCHGHLEVSDTLPRAMDNTGMVVITEHLENFNITREFSINCEQVYNALNWRIRNNQLYLDVTMKKQTSLMYIQLPFLRNNQWCKISCKNLQMLTCQSMKDLELFALLGIKQMKMFTWGNGVGKYCKSCYTATKHMDHKHIERELDCG